MVSKFETLVILNSPSMTSEKAKLLIGKLREAVDCRVIVILPLDDYGDFDLPPNSSAFYAAVPPGSVGALRSVTSNIDSRTPVLVVESLCVMPEDLKYTLEYLEKLSLSTGAFGFCSSVTKHRTLIRWYSCIDEVRSLSRDISPMCPLGEWVHPYHTIIVPILSGEEIVKAEPTL